MKNLNYKTNFYELQKENIELYSQLYEKCKIWLKFNLSEIPKETFSLAYVDLDKSTCYYEELTFTDEEEYDSYLPTGETMYFISDSFVDSFIRDYSNLSLCKELNIRVYEVKEGLFIGIEGYGYSYFDEVWLPLYCEYIKQQNEARFNIIRR